MQDQERKARQVPKGQRARPGRKEQRARKDLKEILARLVQLVRLEQPGLLVHPAQLDQLERRGLKDLQDLER